MDNFDPGTVRTASLEQLAAGVGCGRALAAPVDEMPFWQSSTFTP